MNWENLRKMLCPYCDKELTKDIEVRCTECFFHIDEVRFKSIIENRGFPDRPKIKMRWQNLKDDRCPIDANFLQQNTEGKVKVLKCSKDDCAFKIKDDRLQEILKDEKHSANIFYKPHDTRT